MPRLPSDSTYNGRLRRSSGGLLALAIGLFLHSTALANPPIEEVLTSSDRLASHKQWDKAESLLKKEYDSYERGGDTEKALLLKLRIGVIERRKGNLPIALQIFTDVYKARQSLLGPNHEQTRVALQNAAQTLVDLKRGDDAAKMLNDYTLLKSLSLDNIAWSIQLMRDIAASYEERSQFDAALRISDLLVSNFHERGLDKSDNDYLQTLLSRSALQGASGQLDAAMKTIEKALTEATANEANVGSIALLRANHAIMLDHASNTDRAIDEVLTGLTQLETYRLQKTWQAAEMYEALARLYAGQQYYVIAKAAVERALEVFTAEDEPSRIRNEEYLRSFALLGKINMLLNEKEPAFGALVFSSKQMCDVFGEHDANCIELGLDLAEAYMRFELWGYASRELSKAFDRLDATKSVDARQEMRALVGECQLLATSNLQKALSFCQDADHIAQGADKPDGDSLNVAAQLVKLRLAKGLTAEAAKIGVAALQHAIEKNHPTARQWQFSAVLTTTLSALARIGKVTSDNRQIYEIAFRASQLARLDATDDAIERMQAIKQVTDSERRHIFQQDEQIKEQLTRVSARLSSLQLSSDVFQENNRELKAALTSEVNKLKQQLVNLEANYGPFKNPPELESNSPTTKTLSLREAQESLQIEESCVVYLVFDHSVFVWTIDRTNVSVQELRPTAAELASLVAGIRPQPGYLPGPGEKDVLRGFKIESAYKLYKDIWEPLEANLTGKRLVYVVPDGALIELPYNALLTEDGSGKVRTIDDLRKLQWLVFRPYATAVIPKVGHLRRNSENGTQPAKYVGIGAPVLSECAPSSQPNYITLNAVSDAVDVGTLCGLMPLTLAKAELEELGTRLAPLPSIVLTGDAATESAVRKLNETGDLGGASLLVFSTHGLAAGELDMFTNPARVGARDNIEIPLTGNAATEYVRRSAIGASKKQLREVEGATVSMSYDREVLDTRFRASPGLVLTPSPTARSEPRDDGFLSSREIAALDLNADLVILSACNTADQEREKVADGGIFYGLTESFMAAGANALVVSHWIVASEAAKMTTISLVSLLRSRDKLNAAEALNIVLGDLVTKGPDPHPFFWAPFEYVGRDRRPRL
jgi:hypothetical protein